MELVSAITSVTSGGLLGVIGSLAASGLNIFKQSREHKQNVELKKLDAQIDMKMMQLEAENKERQLQIEREIALDKQEYQALASSIQSQKETTYQGENRWLIAAEFIRKTTRPVLTYYLVTSCNVIYITTNSSDLRTIITNMFVSATATVLAWWFADRTLSKYVSQRVWAKVLPDT